MSCIGGNSLSILRGLSSIGRILDVAFAVRCVAAGRLSFDRNGDVMVIVLPNDVPDVRLVVERRGSLTSFLNANTSKSN